MRSQGHCRESQGCLKGLQGCFRESQGVPWGLRDGSNDVRGIQGSSRGPKGYLMVDSWGPFGYFKESEAVPGKFQRDSGAF